MKSCPYGEETLVAFLAAKLGRPIRWIESRADAFVGSVNGRDHRVELQVGFDPDGRITALKGRVLLDKGADPTPSSCGTAWTGGAVLTSGYRIPAIDIEALGVMTNKTPTGPYRGYGQPESNLAIERALDIAAERLALTPAEIRRRNLVRPQEMPYVRPTGLVLDSGDYERLMDMTLERFGYAQALMRASTTRNATTSIGVGFACYTELTNFGPSAACKLIGIANGGFDVCTLRMEPSGHVRLFISQTPMGQGIETSLSQLCAHELGLSPEDVTVIHGDTLTAPYTAYGSGGSRGAGVGGGAVVLAARDLAGQIRRWGGHLLQVSEDQIILARGNVAVRGEPQRRISISQVAAAAYLGAFCPPGTSPGLEARAAYDPPGLAISYGTVAVEVELDRETGKIRVSRITFGHDCGTQINPEIVDGQVRGGVVQAIGATLFEELRYDDEGRPLLTSMHDYFVPLASDVPAIDLLHLETPSPFSHHGAKGVGESGTIAVPAAIMNAVQNAIGPGVTLTELPLRAERVWQALQAAAASHSSARQKVEKHP
jgi:carbon-monoxide dehydrogenase large subunit